jgi:hypothetical protein
LLYQKKKKKKQDDVLLHNVAKCMQEHFTTVSKIHTWFYTQCIFTVKNEKQVTNDTKSIQISIQCKIITM